MLGRLEMDVDECILAYTSLFKAIFESTAMLIDKWSGNVKGRIDSAVLKECMQNIIKDRGLSETALLNDRNERGCKT